MRKLAVAILSVALAVVIAEPITAQTNDNDYTPLNSRIKRARQFPTELPPRFVPPDKLSNVQRERGRSMFGQLGRCLYRRSTPVALDLLDKTDLGFISFDQIQLQQDRALRIYGFSDCLNRVAEATSSSVAIRFTPGSLRQWLIEAAYFDRYPDGPTWLRPGYVVEEREYPLSYGDASVRATLDVADCIVAADPNNADYFYRTAAGSADESEAVRALVPLLGPCLPQGTRWELSPYMLRLWIGEALWHAAAHSKPEPVEPTAETQ